MIDENISEEEAQTDSFLLNYFYSPEVTTKCTGVASPMPSLQNKYYKKPFITTAFQIRSYSFLIDSF